MKTGLLRDVVPRTVDTPFSEVAWLWMNIGEGRLYPVRSVTIEPRQGIEWSGAICTPDLSDTVERISFACTPDTLVYYFSTIEDKESYESLMRQAIADFRTIERNLRKVLADHAT